VQEHSRRIVDEGHGRAVVLPSGCLHAGSEARIGPNDGGDAVVPGRSIVDREMEHRVLSDVSVVKVLHIEVLL
jgi:hypothetical protein